MIGCGFHYAHNSESHYKQPDKECSVTCESDDSGKGLLAQCNQKLTFELNTDPPFQNKCNLETTGRFNFQIMNSLMCSWREYAWFDCKSAVRHYNGVGSESFQSYRSHKH